MRRMFPVHPISSSIGRLSWRERWPPEAHRGVEERRAHQQHHQPESGVVVPAEGLGALKLTERGVELGWRGPPGLVRSSGLEPGRVERLQQERGRTRRLPPWRAGARRAGVVERMVSPQPRIASGGGDRAEADQDEQNSLVEGEAHRP